MMSPFTSILFIALTSAALSLATDSSSSYDYDVIIMGAGMTGIAAGDILNKAGLNILIIEAQNYIGGRTKVEKFGNYSFDVGASWIEGYCPEIHTDPDKCSYYGFIPSKENPMQAMAAKYNISMTKEAYYWDTTMLSFIPSNSSQSVHFANATQVDEANQKWNITQECMHKLLQQMENDIAFKDISYKSALFECGWKPPLSAIEKAIEYIGFTFEYAEHAKYSSFIGSVQPTFRAYGKYSAFITDTRGYAGITLGLASEYLDIENLSNESKIILNSPITKIEYSKQKRIKVTVADADSKLPKKTFTSRFGLVTFSLGVFQSDLVEYDPPLDLWKQDAFQMSMTDYLPVLVQWPFDFWSKLGVNSHCIQFADPRDSYWSWAYNFDHPDFYPGSLIWRFDIAMDLANRVQFQSDRDTIRELIDQKLSHYFGEGILPEPIAIFHHDWRRNKYIQGSYSNWQVGMSNAKWAKMFVPYTEKGLYFAGEAMSIMSGFVQGAYENGVLVAKEIIAASLVE